MGASKQAWGWYPTGKIWVPLQVEATGKLVIDPTAIFENPPTNGETAKAAQSDWSFDHNANPDAHHARLHALSSALDHSGTLDASQLPTLAALISSGSYTGDSTIGRAIAHGLGKVPKIVFITNAPDGYLFWIHTLEDAIVCWTYNLVLGAAFGTTTPDATNFYVGVLPHYYWTANQTGRPYTWVAIG